jgi:Holliday junction resolvase-like predicted endonuclease
LQGVIKDQLKNANASLEPYANQLHNVESATRGVADVLEQGVNTVKQGVQTVSNVKAQIVEKGLEAAGHAIADSHILDGAKPIVKEALHQADAALAPFSKELRTGAAVTHQVANTAEKAVTVTHLKDVAEVVNAIDDIHSIRHVATGAGQAAKDMAHPASAGRAIEDQARKLPFKEPSPAPKLVEGPKPTRVKLVEAPSSTPKLVEAPEPSHVELVTKAQLATSEKTLGIEDAIDKSRVVPGEAVASEFDTTYRLKQGNFGEKMATDALAQQGHDILDFKPDIKGTNQGGIDIVTMKDGVVYAVDNKAYTTGNNVSSVSALDKNFNKNIATVREKFEGFANDPNRTPAEREKFAQAVEAIRDGRVQKLVTTAAFARDGKMTTGISAPLQNKQFQYQDVSPQANLGAAATEAGGAAKQGQGLAPRPVATEAAPQSGLAASGSAPRPEATQTATRPSSNSGEAPRPAASSAPSRGVAGGAPIGPGGSAGQTQGGGLSPPPAGPAISGGAASSGQAGGSPSSSSGLGGPTPSGSSPNGGI